MSLVREDADVAASSGQDDVIERARELRPTLERNAVEAERLRRLPDENIDAVRSAGLFRLCVPRRFGGYELPLHVRSAVYQELGRGCGSTGWVVSINNELSWLASLFNEEAQTEFFADGPDAIMAGSFNPNAKMRARRVRGGLMVSGKAPMASGCWHADWLGVTVPLVDENGDVPGVGLAAMAWAYLPSSEVSIEETWDVVGMSGTGTHTLVVGEDTFIPDRRLLPWNLLLEPYNAPGPIAHQDEVIYRASGLGPGLMMSPPLLGAARSALEYVLDRASRRGVSYSPYERQIDSVAFQLQVADAAMKLETADLHLKRAVGDLEAFATRGVRPDYATSARVQGECGYVAAQLRDAVDILMSAHGTASFATASPLQRVWRDVNTGGRHGFLNPALCRETYGKSLLGFPTVGPLPEVPE